eukprot:TRINITY_DN3024_c0_g1_i1.p1 TRINITY_DN3024_c0_g1~~TRINITY_DN3024_c0_g1_i1.p1  ORF type:complete len:194 (-),score=40.22 TRINITY_DN3024_c0_g1_i1:102-683(-)
MKKFVGVKHDLSRIPHQPVSMGGFQIYMTNNIIAQIDPYPGRVRDLDDSINFKSFCTLTFMDSVYRFPILALLANSMNLKDFLNRLLFANFDIAYGYSTHLDRTGRSFRIHNSQNELVGFLISSPGFLSITRNLESFSDLFSMKACLSIYAKPTSESFYQLQNIFIRWINGNDSFDNLLYQLKLEFFLQSLIG